jgi:probable HAF family extracellular repeat protein
MIVFCGRSWWKPVIGICGILGLGQVCGAGVDTVYSIVDLGGFGGQSQAYALNNAGQVVGSADYLGGSYHAFIWQKDIGMVDLGTLGGSASFGNAINGRGQVAGYSYPSGKDGDPYHAFLYSSGSMVDIGTLGGKNSIGNSLNDSGHVVGGSLLADNATYHAFLFVNGKMSDIGTLGGGWSNAFAINDDGQIVGASSVGAANGGLHAFLYANGNMKDLGTLGGWYSTASAINSSGQITGASETAGGNGLHAFFYSAGVMTDINPLDGFYSIGNGINAGGQIVGEYQLTDQSLPHAFIYSNGLMTDLNDLINPTSGWTLESAKGINDVGQIVGYGTNAFGQTEGFLLTPCASSAGAVPEPATLGLLAAGGVVMAIRGRRGARRK